MAEGFEDEIRLTLSRLSSVSEAWGFGSYFRGEPYQDIDVVVVVNSEPSPRVYERLRCALRPIEQSTGVEIDLTILTAAEFEQGLFKEPLKRIL